MKFDKGKRRFGIIIIDIYIWVGLIIYYFWANTANSIPTKWAQIVSIVAIILFIFQIIQMNIMRITYHKFMFWYITLQFFFYFGRIIIFWLNLDDQIPWRLFNHYTSANIYHAAIYALCVFQGIFLGMICKERQHNDTQLVKEYKSRKYTGKALRFTGIAICFISFPFLLSYSVSTILAQKSGGYVAIADASGLTQSFYMIFFSGIILLIVSPAVSKKVTFWMCIAYVIYGVSYMILSADRRQIVITMVVMYLCFINIYNIRLKPWIIMSFAVCGYVLLTLLTAISTVRLNGITIPNIIDEVLIQFKRNDLVVQVLGEFGGTLFSIVNAKSYYPSELPFLAGRTYLASVLIIIPGLFTSLFPKLFEQARITANMKAIDGNPCGGSLGQDLYANFGDIGVFGGLLLGMVLARLTRSERKPLPIDSARYYIKFYILLNLVRAGAYEISRTYFMALILMEILFYIHQSISIKSDISVREKKHA